MLKKALILSLVPMVIGLGASVAGAVTADLKLAPGQAASVKSGTVVWLVVNLTNPTKAADMIDVRLTVNVVCPFRPAPIVLTIPMMIPLKAGQAISQRIPMPVPKMTLLKPLAWTVSATCKGLTSKTQANSNVTFTVVP